MQPSLKKGPGLDPNILDLLKRFGEEISFGNDEDLVYKGHIPKFGFVLLEGIVEIHLSRSKKELIPFSILGVKEVLLGVPMGSKIKVYKGAKILKLSKLSILEAQKQPELARFFDQFLSNS